MEEAFKCKKLINSQIVTFSYRLKMVTVPFSG